MGLFLHSFGLEVGPVNLEIYDLKLMEIFVLRDVEWENV